MAVLSGDFPHMVFRRIEKESFGEFSIDNRMLSILINLDGKRTAGQLASQAGITMAGMKEIIAKLLKIGLIEPARDAVAVLDPAFIHHLKLQLSQVVGPIAALLIEDAAGVLGYAPDGVPRHLAAELIDLLSKEITNEGKRAVFTKNMVDRISRKS